jgi:hypothetical protein
VWLCKLLKAVLLLGIMDGRYTKQELALLAATDDAFAHVRSQIATLDCLFLDEASMLSASMFEQVVLGKELGENLANMI